MSRYSSPMAEQLPESPAGPKGRIIAFPDRRAEIAAAARKPPLTGRGRFYVAVGLVCLLPSILWLAYGLVLEIGAGEPARLMDFGVSALSIVGLPILLGWVLLALGLRQRAYDEN